MTYNKSEIMKRAWEIARNASNKMELRMRVSKPASFFMARALESAWTEAKDEQVKAAAEQRAASKPKKRYIELASVAQANGLNHGRTWTADSYTVDKNSLHPSWEGEEICYVYAA